MFTGIVTEVGEVIAATPRAAGMRLRIAAADDPTTVAVGASIACGGPCLTVVERGTENGRHYFDVEASSETLSLTTLGDWATGTRVNLERPLRIGDEFGGHLVSGHVDGVARILERVDEADMARFAFEAPQHLARYIAGKGSVCLDGTSLTVNAVSGRRFGVMIIPHTLAATTWSERKPGDAVNLEVDILARYLERLSGA